MQPSSPIRHDPGPSWEHIELYRRVKEAIAAMPVHFRTETFIAGISATDIHTLNAVLGATIEDQAVATLNAMRSTWDPDGQYALYSFMRQAQTFPDVLFCRLAPGRRPEGTLMGIELKGWYILAKEGEPNFRFQVTPSACNVQDLIVVVPWALSQVISGRPVILSPYIELARYAAEYRNYWWQHIRRAKGDTSIRPPGQASPYPEKSDAILDVPASDPGGNFGRFARTGLMDEYLEGIKSLPLCGIQIQYWLAFFKAFQETRAEEAIRQALGRLAERVREQATGAEPRSEVLMSILEGIEKLVQGVDPHKRGGAPF